MALTDEQLVLQADILASKTDSATNPNMVYKTIASLNKGLNPEVFTANNTKIVNAINYLAGIVTNAEYLVATMGTKMNEALLDLSSDENKAIWEQTKELMGKTNIIEGMQSVLEGQQQDKILGITAADIDKVLSVARNDNGDLVVKAIDMIHPVSKVDEIEYTNNKSANIQNVKDALDYLFENMNNGNNGELGGGVTIGEITWDMIEGKPEIIADQLVLSDNNLTLSGQGSVISTVPLINQQDIDELIAGLDEQ